MYLHMKIHCSRVGKIMIIKGGEYCIYFAELLSCDFQLRLRSGFKLNHKIFWTFIFIYDRNSFRHWLILAIVYLNICYESVLPISGLGSSVAGVRPLGSCAVDISSREEFFLCEDCDGCEAGCDHEDHGLRLLPGSLQEHQLTTGICRSTALQCCGRIRIQDLKKKIHYRSRSRLNFDTDPDSGKKSTRKILKIYFKKTLISYELPYVLLLLDYHFSLKNRAN